MQHTKASRHRDRNSSLSDAEWEQCLTSLLLPETLAVEDLDVNAQLKDDETLTINIQKKASGQTVRHSWPPDTNVVNEAGPVRLPAIQLQTT